jgi:hypothetical protein
MNFIGLLRTLEQITRPPRMGHDVDVVGFGQRESTDVKRPPRRDGAEQLAEREAETECLVPEDFNAVCRCVACVAEERAAEDELAAEEEEAVAAPIRFAAPICARYGTVQCPFCTHCDTKSSASNHAGTGAESAPSPTIVQSAPPPTVDGEGPASVRDIQPSPEAGRPDGDCFDYCVGHPEDATAEWIGEAVPVIRGVLRSHMLRPDWGRTTMCQCLHLFRSPTAAEDWRNHVAALIANTLAPHDK